MERLRFYWVKLDNIWTVSFLREDGYFDIILINGHGYNRNSHEDWEESEFEKINRIPIENINL